LLVDSRCPKVGVVTSPHLRDPSVPNPLAKALVNGCAGTIDKIISGVWVGEFHFDASNAPGTGKFPRWMDLLQIEKIYIEPRPGAPKCRDS
jgi:hypothetical protein